jgi:hypothetical protein
MKNILHSLKDIRPINSKAKAHGYWVVYWTSTGELKFKGRYINDREVGYFEDYNDIGTLWRKEFIII